MAIDLCDRVNTCLISLKYREFNEQYLFILVLSVSISHKKDVLDTTG